MADVRKIGTIKLKNDNFEMLNENEVKINTAFTLGSMNQVNAQIKHMESELKYGIYDDTPKVIIVKCLKTGKIKRKYILNSRTYNSNTFYSYIQQ